MSRACSMPARVLAAACVVVALSSSFAAVPLWAQSLDSTIGATLEEPIELAGELAGFGPRPAATLAHDQARDLLNTLRSEDEQPAPAAAPRAIPPTAPLLDINAAENERPIYPLQIDAAPQRPQRPRAQPAPARAAPPAKEQPPRPIPLAAPEPRQSREPAPRRTTTRRAALRQERSLSLDELSYTQ